MNPKWKRVINVSKIRIELLKMKLQMEFQPKKDNQEELKEMEQKAPLNDKIEETPTIS